MKNYFFFKKIFAKNIRQLFILISRSVYPFFPAVKRAPDGSFITLGTKTTSTSCDRICFQTLSVNNNSNREIKAAEFNPSNAKIQHQQERRSKQKIFKVFLTPNRPLLQRFTRETKSPAGWLFESSFT